MSAKKRLEKKGTRKALKLISKWRGRIYTSGHTQKSFCEEINLCPAQLSFWLRFRHLPCKKNIDLVENALKELGV